jgi:manganese-dependent inorganic pyrophosphatase
VDSPHQDTIFVIGHRNPDTDAICSAIGYAAFLRASHPEVDARPARCGELNARTSWVLAQAKVETPRLMMDVRPTAGTVCQRGAITVRREETFLSVYRKMVEHGFRSLPVVDENGCIIGMPSLHELVQLFLPAPSNDHDANRHVRSSEANMLAELKGTFRHDREPSTQPEDYILTVAGSSLATAEERMRRFPRSSVIMLVGDRPDVQRMALSSGARCLIVTGGFDVDDETANLARQKAVPIILTPYDTASAAQIVRFSRPISDALISDCIRFKSTTPLKEVIATVHDSNQPLFAVVDDDGQKLIGVISKSDLVDVPRTKLALVDHNEFSQAVTGADEAEILEVLDHHRLSGDLRTREPVRFINEPVGSTSTLVAMMYRLRGLVPDRSTAICLSAGLIADTLKLTSPTTTNTDREILPWLAGLGGIDIDEFASGFFSAGSMLKDNAPEVAIESDRKAFEESGWRFSLSQIEELGLDEFWKHETALLEALKKLVAAQGLHFAGLLVTDIAEHNSLLLVVGDDRVEEAVEYPRIKRHLFELNGVVSRKKQLLPYVCRLVGRLTA